MREIQITDIAGVALGHASDQNGGTGCTVVLVEGGAPAGVDIRGGGPATRETELLRPTAAAAAIHGLLLSGGSAFSLGAADGVMAFLSGRDIGVDVGVARVPLVVQADIFDLDYRDSLARPDAAMAEAACADAMERASSGKPLPQGSVGVGCGATIGKAKGPAHAMKSGVGHYAVQLGAVKLGALAVCNAIGDVFDIDTAAQVGGMRAVSGAFDSSEQYLYDMMTGTVAAPLPLTNTTLGVIITNVASDKMQMTRLAMMAQNGLARTIRPVHTSFDGDAVFALSVGQDALPPAALDGLGTLAAYALGKAINNAVRFA